MEKDDEVKGEGNSYDFGARFYDSRVGRWLSRDPLEAKYPNLNPYNFVANSLLIFKDADGRVIIWGDDAKSLAAKEEALKLAKKSKVFAALYKALDEHHHVFNIRADDAWLDENLSETTNGVFRTKGGETHEIILREQNASSTIAEEFFHGFQFTEYGLEDREVQEYESEANLLQVLVLGEINGHITMSPDATLELATDAFFSEMKKHGYKIIDGSDVMKMYFDYLELQELLTEGQPVYGGPQRKLLPEAFNEVVNRAGLTSDDIIKSPSSGIEVTPENSNNNNSEDDD